MTEAHISARTIALLAEHADLRRLRVAYRADQDLYAELLAVSAITLAYRANPEVRTEIGAYVQPQAFSEMTTAEAAAHLGITPSAVLKAIHGRRLTARRRGGCWLVDTGSVARYTPRATRTRRTT